MALFDGGVWYAAYTFTENGEVVNRRIQRMEVQAPDGHLYVLEKRALPDRIDVNTGVGFKGEHLMTILLGSKNAPRPPKVKGRAWPSPRDVANIAVGILFAAVLVRIVSILVNS